MRALVLALGLLALAEPCYADWDKFSKPDLGFMVGVPAPLVESEGTYKGAIAGNVKTRVFKTVHDKITYQVTVIDFRKRIEDSVTLWGEAYFLQTERGKVVNDIMIRTEPFEGGQYGRQVVVDTRDGTRVAATIYMSKGLLYIFETDAPADSDRQSPDPSRFLYSVQFNFDFNWTIPPNLQGKGLQGRSQQGG